MGLPTRRRPAALPLLLALATGLAACGGDDATSTAPPPPRTKGARTVTVTVPAETTTGTASEPEGTTTAAEEPDPTTTEGGDDGETTTEPPPTTTATRPELPPPGPPGDLLLGVQDDALLTSAEPNAMPATRGLGPRVIRYNVAWDAVAPRRPRRPENPADRAYDWTAPDRLVLRARRLRAEVLLTIVQAPTWANGGRPGRFAPNDPADFGRFCRAVATRYAGGFRVPGVGRLPAVRRYTVWNEVNRGQYFQPQGPGGEIAPMRYAGLANACVPAVKAANPRAVVAIGPLASRGAQGGLPPLEFLEAYRAAGGPAPEAMAINAYQNGLLPEYVPDEELPDGAITLRNLDQLRDALRRLTGKAVPVWVTEFAWRTAPTPRLGTLTAEQQAQLLGDTVELVRTRLRYVDMLVWFLVRDESPTSYWRSGLVDFSWKRKPAYRVYARLADDAAP